MPRTQQHLHSTPPPPEHRIPKPPDGERHDQPVPVDLPPEPVLPEPMEEAPSHRVSHRLPAIVRRILH